MSADPDERERNGRWIDAIGADIAFGWSQVVAFLLAAATRFPGWAARIRDWFGFVARRQPDLRFAVFPGWLRAAEGIALAGSAILLVVLFFDPIYLAWTKTAGAGQKPIFEFVTRFGKSDWILIGSGLVIVGISLLTADRFKGAQKAVIQRILLNAYYLFTTVAFSGLLTNLFKYAIGRARPPWTAVGEIWVSDPFRHNYHYAAFPSGHATTAGALAVALSLLFPGFRVFFLLAGAWIAVSRPALGVHFPSDVLAGFLFGGAFSYYYALTFARKRLLFVFDQAGQLRLRAKGGNAALRLLVRDAVGAVARSLAAPRKE